MTWAGISRSVSCCAKTGLFGRTTPGTAALNSPASTYCYRRALLRYEGVQRNRLQHIPWGLELHDSASIGIASLLPLLTPSLRLAPDLSGLAEIDEEWQSLSEHGGNPLIQLLLILGVYRKGGALSAKGPSSGKLQRSRGAIGGDISDPVRCGCYLDTCAGYP